jgi:hypothetical protein
MLDRSSISNLELGPREEYSDSQDTDDWIRCRRCGNRITFAPAAGELAGNHVHRRVNPGGVRFEFGIFTRAPGCTALGSPVEQHTWFSGYAWDIVQCAACGEHLGWRFSRAQTDPVFGLIFAKLVHQGDA